MFAYCGNNPISRNDDGGKFWNVVIGATVGAVISAATTAFDTYKQTGSVDWGKVAIAGAVGAISGGIAATGLGMVSQAVITAGAAFAGDVATQTLCEKKTLDNVNFKKAVHNSMVAGASSVIGSVIGSVASVGYSSSGKALVNAGKNKLLTGYVKQAAGQSHSQLIRQGNRLVAKGIKYINTGRAVSSVMGSIYTWGISRELSW